MQLVPKAKERVLKSISGFTDWKQKPHAEDWILYPESLSNQISLDEVALSDGELYTVLTSKKSKRKERKHSCHYQRNQK